jgi:FlaA1/EpsC-like NDP-sugar epimerase
MRNVLIYGAGEAGTIVFNEINKHPEERIRVFGFIDDDKNKIGKSIKNVQVLGGKSDLKKLIKKLDIDEVIIAMPSIAKNVIKEIVKTCKSEKVKLLIVPSTMEIIEGTVRFDQIKTLDLADLLDRDEVRIHSESIKECIEGRKVMVTGAAGSIGNVLVRELINFNPISIIALDINENGLFYLTRDVKNRISNRITSFVPCVADIKDKKILEELFYIYEPEILIHAAAYKHVPMMENHLRILFLNNVIGTKNLLELSRDFGVDKFIGISTDKAVYPVSVMGKTKRICEQMICAFDKLGVPGCSVRFGNVLGSNGSVITIFQDQIKSGGPVTITSPNMERYFMTAHEAACLVLQAGSVGQDGNIYVLDMGKPIKIQDLAENLIILSGLTPGVDIKINYTGIRAGEKLTEELFYNDAEKCMSDYFGIYIEKISLDPDFLIKELSTLTTDIYHLTGSEINNKMDSLIKLQTVLLD